MFIYHIFVVEKQELEEIMHSSTMNSKAVSTKKKVALGSYAIRE